MKRQLNLFLFISLLLTLKCYAMQDTSLLRLFPDSSFLPVTEEQTYKSANELYDYINGGAELYLQYGFQKLTKRIYSVNQEQEIKAEIFQLNAPKNAFGIFSYSMDTVNTDVGQGGQYIGGSLIFWQDNYFVSIFARQENELIKEKILELGRSISDAIDSTGALPWVFHILPQDDINPTSTFYFHHHAWQNKYRFISNENIFNINHNVNAFLTQYGTHEDRYYRLLIEYPSIKKAKEAYTKGRSHIPKKLSKHRVSNHNKKWYGYERSGMLLMYVFDAPLKEDVEYLLDQTSQNSAELR